MFCGSYSNDGDIFICAPQGNGILIHLFINNIIIYIDSCIRLYNTEGSKFNCYKNVDARDVGWSVLSTALR